MTAVALVRAGLAVGWFTPEQTQSSRVRAHYYYVPPGGDGHGESVCREYMYLAPGKARGRLSPRPSGAQCKTCLAWVNEHNGGID